jgi:NAD(P)-dependent dehydrogenase (short-subunit alcohol dehydrogenase family)
MEEPRQALVTGASRGIGAGIARRLAAEGFSLLLQYNVSRDAAEAVAAALPGAGHRTVQANLDDLDGVLSLAASVDGPLALLVHNAGIYLPSPCDGGDLPAWRDSWRRQFQVNLFAAADLTFALLPQLEEGRGAVIHVASRAGFRGESGFSAYAASKAGMINLTKSLAAELAPRGIGVFCVAPGWVRTDMAAEAISARGDAIRAEIPQGRVAEPEDIANLVAFFARPESRYLSGVTVDVTGGSYLH